MQDDTPSHMCEIIPAQSDAVLLRDQVRSQVPTSGVMRLISPHADEHAQPCTHGVANTIIPPSFNMRFSPLYSDEVTTAPSER